jgi:tetratricopeptide (TPR) repeat protein
MSLGETWDAFYYSGKRTASVPAYEKAISLAKARLQVNPREASVLGNLASYLSILGDRSAAISYLNDALKVAQNTLRTIACRFLTVTCPLVPHTSYYDIRFA